ncbi:phosphoglycolate phosphatase [Halarchaeum acidiphilum MH1-52-1]|uniref:Phosphoglycolate phosphatase n=1 Tax=Halarchaeum acidiphilum MH1-52-1 TaxID=1261545 RepID=U2YUD5_9EURY|nr:HAD-IA family hydrolase [Halarchaeum acidiphilum]GAD52630.1 phosphoglycolate phosphatase [Halarchaeum acidiphilum MH1-52-1]
MSDVTGDGDYDGVVYDLDGTLVRLAVDWGAVERDLTDLLTTAGVDATGFDAWEFLDAAEGAGIRAEADALIRDYERDGAERAERLPHADELRDGALPAAVCSLNCERACRIALEKEGLTERVRAVVGRDTVSGRKPDPEPLLRAVESLGLDPAGVVFVGDSERDAETARRAGTGFRYA